eukprot:TRINITY_DN13984_c0_g1_i1.p1 TRINITY_DN13984_c0_g1~~TRINITY_DN13984_c0_g1_i1.p1  ORF type:complete len:292 (+),score=48.33 TRINITY_DN13984_c0_g1_i1:30-878(+)
MSQIFTTVESFSTYRKGLPSSAVVGFIPTMGFLHEGHLSLVQLSKKACDYTVVSIFVNPKQFAPTEDFNSYPRDTDRDIKLLLESSVDAVFLPSSDSMYPPGFDTKIFLSSIEETMEGRARPGFFGGVAIVVLKLSNIVQPDFLYLGQKDGIQCICLKTLFRDLNSPVSIVIGPTSREPDGLARSSRNVYLSESERKIATILYKALMAGKTLFEKGEILREKIFAGGKEVLASEKIVVLQYLSLADLETGKEVDQVPDGGAMYSGAILIGKTRLIDNVLLKR